MLGIELPSLPKALQVLCHLFRQRQVFGVKSFDLIDRRPSVLGKVEDVHFAMAVDDPLEKWIKAKTDVGLMGLGIVLTARVQEP